MKELKIKKLKMLERSGSPMRRRSQREEMKNEGAEVLCDEGVSRKN